MRSSDHINVGHMLIELPLTIKNHRSNAQLAANTLCVHNFSFLTSMSNHTHYRTSNAVDNLKAISLEEGLKNVIQSCALRGFKVVIVLVDMQLKCLKDQNKIGVPVNVISTGEHVKRIERFHRLIEE